MSWTNEANDEAGGSTIWLHPQMPLEFSFNGSRNPQLNREWIETLLQAANSADGLRMIPEARAQQE